MIQFVFSVVVFFKRISQVGLIVLMVSTGVRASDSPVLNIFMIQNSGWMEPFYEDSNSQFKSLVATVIEKTNPGMEGIVVASFNQSLGENISPLLAYRGNDRTAINKAIQGVNLAKKPGGAYADTDFREAIVGAITQNSPGSPCILWIFTNNKNSPQNSEETAARNKEFYNWLQSEGNIKRIVAYPYPMKVQGKHFQANGMMIYALAYGEPADEKLKKLIASGLPFKDQPARLKPLNADAITFVPTTVTGQGNFKAALGSDNQTLELQFDSSSKPEVAVINGVFTNNFFPYDIQSADVSFSVKFQGDSHDIQSAIEPEHVSEIPTGKSSKPVQVKIGIPSLPSIWKNPEIIFKSGYQAPAIMEFVLANQNLKLSPEFVKRMDELFPGDPLPEIFVPGESAKQSATSRPLVVNVVYPIWPLFVLILAILLVIAGIIIILKLFTGTKKFTVVVDGMQKTYILKVFGECSLYSSRGEQIGNLKRGLFKPVVDLDKGRNEQVKIM